jgi:hypothetical protein
MLDDIQFLWEDGMRKIMAAILLMFPAHISCMAQEQLPAARISAVRQSCQSDCRDRDAIVFVHGIYGGDATFKNGSFDWPSEFPQELGGRKIDVFRVEYTTAMFAWLRRNIATFDDVVQTLYDSMYGDDPGGKSPLIRNKYRSIGYVAHSLGGNLVSAYIHSVKTWRGHVERARNSYVITLGTPINGAQIANLGLVAKWLLGMDDPLLSSLERDNTFVRMLQYWKRAEISKGETFGCRPIKLYVGLEGSWLAGLSVVDESSALEPMHGMAHEHKSFPDYNHEQLAKPAGPSDPVYQWVSESVTKEMQRLNQWQGPLCSRQL